MPKESLKDLDRARWEQVIEILTSVWDLPEDRIDPELERLCGGDTRLRTQVETLLNADRDSTGFFAQATREFFGSGESEAAPEDGPPLTGCRIGAYRVLGEIGRGGMGRVYLAERADGQFDQTVAIKLLKRGLDTDEILDRFLRERQILARLRHPNIAVLLDGGVTEDGLPWFALEYVDGIPIDRYCETRREGLRSRIALFLTCCRAVAFAHRNLVVHRDLKPGNILVSSRGEVKLLDFGIAKLLDPSEDGSEATTGPVGLMTPLYAAPEQVLGEHPTTATDVYSLGVVLYRLLAGVSPYQGDLHGSRRREAVLHQIPQPLSVRVPPQADGGLRRALRGDLDNIVLQALRKEPEERYRTADALADDLERYLAGQPVLATGRRLGYVARKWVERHRTAAVAAALVLTSLVGGLVATTWQARRTTDQARRAEQIKAFTVDIFKGSNPMELARGDQTTARELLDRGAERVERELRGQPAMQAEMWGVLGDVYRGLGAFPRAASLYARSVEARRSLGRPAEPLLARALRKLGEAEVEYGRNVEAERHIREGLAIHGRHRRRLTAEDPLYTASLAAAIWPQGRVAEAESLYRESIRLDSLTRGLETRDAAQDMGNLSILLFQDGRIPEAITYAERSLGVLERKLGRDHPQTAVAMNQLANCLSAGGRGKEAIVLLHEALGIRWRWLPAEHEQTAFALHNLASAFELDGSFDSAAFYYGEALRMRTRVLDPFDPNIAHTRNNLAIVLYRLGRYNESAEQFREADRVWSRTLPENHPSRLRCRHNLGAALRELGRYGESDAILGDVLDRRIQTLGAENFDVSLSYQQIGILRRLQGRTAEAESLCRSALALRRHLLGDGHSRVAESQTALADLYRFEGRYAEGAALYDRALAILRASFSEPTLQLADALVGKGRLLLESRRAAEAEPLLREALAVRSSKLAPGDARVGESRVALGLCLTTLHQDAEARALLREGIPVLAARPGAREPLLAQGRSALARSTAAR